MCGIVGYVGERPVRELLLGGLRKPGHFAAQPDDAARRPVVAPIDHHGLGREQVGHARRINFAHRQTVPIDGNIRQHRVIVFNVEILEGLFSSAGGITLICFREQIEKNSSDSGIVVNDQDCRHVGALLSWFRLLIPRFEDAIENRLSCPLKLLEAGAEYSFA